MRLESPLCQRMGELSLLLGQVGKQRVRESLDDVPQRVDDSVLRHERAASPMRRAADGGQ